MKRKLFLLVSSILISILLIVSFIGFQYQNIDLSSISKVYGKVSIFEICEPKNHSKLLCVNLIDNDIQFGVYRYSKNFSDLLDKIDLGNLIEIYFIPHKNNSSINLDVVQIEQNDLIILSKKEFEEKYRIVMLVCLLGAIIMFVLFYLFFKKKIAN
ncbi:hypothetical protein [uncultured Winogradskyella sp.]|uniref:hypothetical protein n=1 Tax=uncultured Winogradskyella sp. TaxID=395353 RepID=UPI00261BCC6C|nr:hypothetical protein [uncultured Winogradskyella sp.]